MKYILIILLLASAAIADPVPSGRYVGTAVVGIDELGCVASGKCQRSIPISFSFRNNGTTGSYVNSKNGMRFNLIRSVNGTFSAEIARGYTYPCGYFTYVHLMMQRGRVLLNTWSIVSCDDGSQATLTYNAYPRRVR